MTDTVYDTTYVAVSNGDLAGRRAGNALDRRLTTIEEFLKGNRVAWYNGRLSKEYEMHVRQYRNDIVEAFFVKLVDSGRRSRRSTLSTSKYAVAKRIRWPAHDQHLLAAAIEGRDATIFVTEEALGRCAGAVGRHFGVRVVRIV